MNKPKRGSRKKRILKRQLRGIFGNNQCCFCDRAMRVGTETIEHVIPLSAGGGWHLGNLRISCAPCNHERGSMPFDEYARMKAAEGVQASNPW